MFNKIKELTSKMHIKFLNFKNDEKGMEVIQVVMLVMVGVVIISAVWAAMNGLLEEWWDIIFGNSDAQESNYNDNNGG